MNNEPNPLKEPEPKEESTPQENKKRVLEKGVQGAGARYPGQKRAMPRKGTDEHMGAEESDRPGGISPQEARKANYSRPAPSGDAD